MDIPRNEQAPSPAVRRLSLYLRQLESFARQDRKTISSKQLGDSLGLTDAQVRKDLTYFGQFGHPGIGYRVEELIARLRSILGTDRIWPVALVGAGNLGRALAAYRGFEAKGFRLAAVFDDDPTKIGKQLGGHTIAPIKQLSDLAKTGQIRLVILAVPADAAQDVADQIVDAGIKGILNFAPVTLSVPADVSVNSVDLAVQLEQIAFAISLAE